MVYSFVTYEDLKVRLHPFTLQAEEEVSGVHSLTFRGRILKNFVETLIDNCFLTFLGSVKRSLNLTREVDFASKFWCVFA